MMRVGFPVKHNRCEFYQSCHPLRDCAVCFVPNFFKISFHIGYPDEASRKVSGLIFEMFCCTQGDRVILE